MILFWYYFPQLHYDSLWPWKIYANVHLSGNFMWFVEVRLRTPVKNCTWTPPAPCLSVFYSLLEVIAFQVEKYVVGAFRQVMPLLWGESQILSYVYLLSYSAGQWGIRDSFRLEFDSPTFCWKQGYFQFKPPCSQPVAVKFENIWDITGSPTLVCVLNHLCDEDFFFFDFQIVLTFVISASSHFMVCLWRDPVSL